MDRRILTIAAAVLLMVGCSKDLHPPHIEVNNAADEKIAGDFVTLGQVKSVAQKMFPQTRTSEDTVCEVDVVTSDAGDTLMYIVNNLGGGWKVLSADARTPAVLAEGDEGSFSLEDACDGLKVWMDCVASNMEAVRSAATDELNFTPEGIAANRSFWGVDAQPAALSPTPLPNPEGQWHVSTSSTEYLVEEMGHLSPRWSQNEAYSAYCPYRNDDSGVKAPAGCVAVAGAQVLYYLHYKLGKPATMISSGYCEGDVDGFTRSFSDETSEVWSQMSPDYHSLSGSANAEALLIGYVGKEINVHYHNDYSWAIPNNLRTRLFGPLGISSKKRNYSADTVKTYLDRELPVIVTASSQAIPTDFLIHCFVLDGYRKTYTKYTHYHYWVPDDLEDRLGPEQYEPYYTYNYSEPEITAVRINWGWDSQWVSGANDGWYSLTDDWLVSGGVNYIYNRTMIYGFEVTD